MMLNENNVFTVNNLQIAYENNQIISDLSIKKRDILIFLGPNSAGKTALLRALQNLIPYQGTVSWKAQKISYLPPQEFLQRQNLPPLNPLGSYSPLLATFKKHCYEIFDFR